VGLGRLTSAGCLSIPALCPMLSSIMILLFLLFPPFEFPSTQTREMLGGLLLALGTVMGAGMQLLVVGACKYCLNLKKQRIMCNVSMITEPGTRAVIKVLFTSCVTSGVLQIAVYTDLFFSSFIPEAAAGSFSNTFAEWQSARCCMYRTGIC